MFSFLATPCGPWAWEYCWNLLESTPYRILLIKSSYKLTQVLIIISNSKLGIWICSQPRIYLHSQSNFYYVPSRPYIYLYNTLYKTAYRKHILHLVLPDYDTFTLLSRQFIFLCILNWQDPIVMATDEQNFEDLICQSHNCFTAYLHAR